MTVQPLVSVITPAYNAARFIRETLDSALAQTYPRVEVIVVDDGSTDGTAEILRGYGSRLRFVHQENQGVSAARNRGLQLARGELIAFLDADDVWLPEKLMVQVEVCMRYPEAGMVTCGTYYIDQNSSVFGERKPSRFGNRQRTFQEFLIRNRIYGGPATVMVPKRCLDAVGDFNRRLLSAEEWDLWIRLLQRFDIQVIDRPLSQYRVHPGNSHKHIVRMMQSQYAVIRAHRKSMSWLDHRKAVSFMYADAAGEYEEKGERIKMLWHALCAIGLYPLRIGPGDDKYAVVFKSVLPRWLKRIPQMVRERFRSRREILR